MDFFAKPQEPVALTPEEIEQIRLDLVRLGFTDVQVTSNGQGLSLPRPLTEEEQRRAVWYFRRRFQIPDAPPSTFDVKTELDVKARTLTVHVKVDPPVDVDAPPEARALEPERWEDLSGNGNHLKRVR